MLLFNPIYKRNAVTDEMIPDFKSFETMFWFVEYYVLLQIEKYGYNKFVIIIKKIRKNDFYFSEEEFKDFNKLVELLILSITHKYSNDEEYAGKSLNDDDELICCNKVKNHLKFILPVFDYAKMKENNKEFCEDLCQYVFHPERVNRLADKLGVTLDDYLNII